MNLDPEDEKKNCAKVIINKPILNSIMIVKNKLNKLQLSKVVDERFAELWNPNLQPPKSKCPYDIMNIMDDDVIPQLEVRIFLMPQFFFSCYYYLIHFIYYSLSK